MDARTFPRCGWLALLVLLVSVGMAWGAGTPAGTIISNIASADYRDVKGNPLPRVLSNKVTTVVSQVPGTDISPASASEPIVPGGSATYHFDVLNTGNGPDVFDLSVAGVPANWTAVIYNDLNDNGILEADEAVPTNVVTSVSLAPDAAGNYLLVVTAPESVSDGEDASMTVTSTSQFDTGVSDTASNVVTVTAASVSVIKEVTPSIPQPGDVVTYAIRGENTGTSTAYNVVVADLLPPGLTYVPGSIRMGQGEGITYDLAAPLTDADDGDPADYGISAASTVTVQWGDSPPGQTGAVLFQATVDEGLISGTGIDNIVTIIYESPEGNVLPTFTAPPGELTVIFEAAPELVLPTVSTTAELGEALDYALTVTNGGNGDDVLNITTSSTGGFPNVVWLDANGDGIPGNNGDVLLSDTDGDGNPDTGNLAPGESADLIVVVTIPPGTGDGTVDVTTVTVSSSNDPAVSASGTVTTTVKSPVIQVVKSVTPLGDQPPGQVLTYTLVVTNTGQGTATDAIITDPVPVNTTYVAGTITVDGISRTDANDADNAMFVSHEIVATLGSIGPAGSHTIAFSVTID